MLASTIDFPILSMLVVVPFVGALLVLLLSRRRPEYMRLVAGTAATLRQVISSSPLSVWLAGSRRAAMV